MHLHVGRVPSLVARTSLVLALALAGCVAPALPKPQAGTSPEGEKVTSNPRAIGAPATSAKRAPLAAKPLVKPLAAGVKLAGKILADHTYLRAGGLALAPTGNALIGADGASMVAAGAGNAVAVTGDDLAAKGGVGIVAAGGGNIFAAGGGNLIGPDGASLVGPDGASLVGPDGASLVGPDGASLIGPDGATFRLAQAGAAAGAEVGAQLPVAGMLVSVVSLATREYLPIGETADGKKVYTVYTDAEGGFAVTVPPSEDANVLVVASLPGRQEAGTILNALTPPATDVAVDEDVATVTRYLRRAMVQRLADVVAAPTLDEARKAIARDARVGEGGRALFQGLAETFHTLGQVRGLPTLTDRALAVAQARVLTAAVIDDALARVDVGGITIDPAIAPKWGIAENRLTGFPAEGARAREVLLACFRALRARASAKMATPAGGYAPLPADFFTRVALGTNPEAWVGPSADWTDWFGEVLGRYPTGPYAVTKPGEVGDFLADRYFGMNRVFITEPPLAAYILLDPKTYQADTRFPLAGEPYHAEATAMLARINAKFGGFGGKPVTPTDPQFNGWARDANRPYVESVSAAGVAYFLQVGLAVSGASERARAVAATVALPASAPQAE